MVIRMRYKEKSDHIDFHMDRCDHYTQCPMVAD